MSDVAERVLGPERERLAPGEMTVERPFPNPYRIIQAPSAADTGMGANLRPGGCSFRVWAPNASKVELLIRPYSIDAIMEKYFAMELAPDRQDGEYWSADVAGVSAQHEYLFRITNRGGTTYNPGSTVVRVDPYARDVMDSGPDLPAIVSDPTFVFSPFVTPKFENLIIYQMHVGSFACRNDGLIPVIDPLYPGWPCARFTQIMSKIHYIRSMGFNAIQMLPCGEYRGAIGQGYSPTNYFAPESSYGTPLELRLLIDICHKSGLAVFFDVVYNHLDNNDNRLWQFDGNTGNRSIEGNPNTGGGIYISRYDTNPPFGRRPLHESRNVQNFFIDNARMWLREYNIDGLRFDSAHNIEAGGLKRIIDVLAREFPDKFLYAEYDNPEHGLARHPFDGAWDMKHESAFREILDSGDIRRVAGDLLSCWGFPTSFGAIKYFLGSHDQIMNHSDGGDYFQKGGNRYFVERIAGIGGRDNWHARAKARMGWALNIAAPCTPLMFMGTECHHYGYWNPAKDSYDDHRFDWNLTGDQIGMEMRNLVAAANQVRWDNPALRGGLEYALPHVDPDNRVLAFRRWNSEGNVVLVVANFSDNQWELSSYGVKMDGETGRWEEILNSQAPQFGGWNDSGNYSANLWVQSDGKLYIRLPKWSVLMFAKR